MLHEDLPRGVSISEPEVRIDLGNGLIPLQFALVNQLGEEQRRHGLGIGGGGEERVGVDRIRLAVM